MRRLPAVFLLVVAGSLAGCTLPLYENACTLIGCGDSIEVDLGDVADEGFQASVESAAASGGFTCSPANADGVISSTPTDLSGDFASEDAALMPSCSADGFLLARRRDGDPPTTITVEATGATSGTVVQETFADIDYEVSQPNGPDCEPTCFHTTLSVTGP